MKITIGGSMSYKIQGRQYESIDASSVFTIEKEFSEEQKIDNEELNKIFDKTTEKLSQDVVKKLGVAVRQYKSKVEDIKKLLK